MSDVVRFLTQRGGFATRAEVLEATGRTAFDRAVRVGHIVWVSRGRYGLPGLDLDLMTAHGMRAVLSHVSAALWHGWEVKTLPGKTHVTVPRRRRVATPPTVVVHRSDLVPGDVVDGICTSVRRTLLDCLRTLPADEGLAIADSALRHGVRREVITEIGATVRGRGRPTAVHVAHHADGHAANPFESCLRALALQVAGLDVHPQLRVIGSRTTVRPDLVDPRLRIILEADSFEWHGDRSALRRDARRYNLLVVDGWTVLRFSWEDVMHDPAYVLDVLQRVVDARTQVVPGRGQSA